MSTSDSMHKITFLRLSAAILWVLVIAGCKTLTGAQTVEKYNQNPLTVVVPNNLSPDEVEQAMVQVLTARQWIVTQRSPKEVVGQLTHRQWEAKVTLKVDGNVIKILSDATHKNASTGIVEPAVPKGWLENLQGDLVKRLGAIPG